MNRDEVVALPAVVDVPTAADVLGVSRQAAYDLIGRGAWPTPVLRLGKLIRVPTAPLLALVGVEEPVLSATAPTSPASSADVV